MPGVWCFLFAERFWVVILRICAGLWLRATQAALPSSAVSPPVSPKVTVSSR